MPRTQNPVPRDRPGRPLWVYSLGVVLVLLLGGAIVFALAFHSEANVDPGDAEPPIVTPRTAPTDGEN